MEHDDQKEFRKLLNEFFKRDTESLRGFHLNKNYVLSYLNDEISEGFIKIHLHHKSNYNDRNYITCEIMDEPDLYNQLHSLTRSFQLPITKDFKIPYQENVISILKDQEYLDIQKSKMRKFIEALEIELKYLRQYNMLPSIGKMSGWHNVTGDLNYSFSPSFCIDEYAAGIRNKDMKRVDFEKVHSYLSLTKPEVSLTLYSYMLLSLTFMLLYPNPDVNRVDVLSKKPLYDLFGICVSGKSGKATCKSICNIFFNFAERKLESIHSISLRHYISSESAKEKIRSRIEMINDCPMILFASKKSFHKDSYLVSNAMKICKKGMYPIFPVFVSANPFYRDDILTVDITGEEITNHAYSIVVQEYDVLPRFVKDFTDYLSGYDWRSCCDEYNKMHEYLRQDERTDPNKLGKYQLLLYAYNLYLQYGVFLGISKKKMEDMFFRAVDTFSMASLEEILPHDIVQEDEPFVSFKQYIFDIFSNLHDSDYVHFIKMERNPPHFECYYIDYDKYWAAFILQYKITISKRIFENALLERNIILTNGVGRLDLIRRDIAGLEHKCLVVNKAKLDMLDINGETIAKNQQKALKIIRKKG